MQDSEAGMTESLQLYKGQHVWYVGMCIEVKSQPFHDTTQTTSHSVSSSNSTTHYFDI